MVNELTLFERVTDIDIDSEKPESMVDTRCRWHHSWTRQERIILVLLSSSPSWMILAHAMDPPINEEEADLHAPINEEEVYDYYARNLLPALLSSLPILLSRLANDAGSYLWHLTTIFIQFLFPVWFCQWTADTTGTIARAAREVSKSAANSTFVDYIIEKLDLNNDGRVSRTEIWSGNAEDLKKEVESLIHQYYHAVAVFAPAEHRNGAGPHAVADSWYEFLRTTISRCLSLDWSIGAYIWSTCSGLILVLVVTSVVPGRLHGWTGRALRFPVLGITYLLIAIELAMYTLVRN